MGFSVAVAFVLLVASLFIAFSVLGTVIGDVRELNVIAKKEKKEDMEVENTNFEIVSVNAQNTSLTTYDLSLVLYNSGSVTLESSKFSFLVDGELVNSSSITYNSTYFHPLEYLQVKIRSLQGSVGSTHRIKVVSENGVEKYASYTVS